MFRNWERATITIYIYTIFWWGKALFNTLKRLIIKRTSILVKFLLQTVPQVLACSNSKRPENAVPPAKRTLLQNMQPHSKKTKTCMLKQKTQTRHENDAKSLLLPSKFILLSGRLEHTSHLKFSSCALEKCYRRYRQRLQTSPRIFISAFHSILCTSHYHRQGILYLWREHSNMASCCMDFAMWSGIHQILYSDNWTVVWLFQR